MYLKLFHKTTTVQAQTLQPLTRLSEVQNVQAWMKSFNVQKQKGRRPRVANHPSTTRRFFQVYMHVPPVTVRIFALSYEANWKLYLYRWRSVPFSADNGASTFISVSFSILFHRSWHDVALVWPLNIFKPLKISDYKSRTDCPSWYFPGKPTVLGYNTRSWSNRLSYYFSGKTTVFG